MYTAGGYTVQCPRGIVTSTPLARADEWSEAFGMAHEKDAERRRLQGTQRAAERLLAELPNAVPNATQHQATARMTENDPHTSVIHREPATGPGFVRVAWMREDRDAQHTPGHFDVSVERGNRESLAAPEVRYDEGAGEWVGTKVLPDGKTQAAVDAILDRVLDGLRRLDAAAG